MRHSGCLDHAHIKSDLQGILESTEDRGEIIHAGIILRGQHAMQAFAGLFGERGQQRFRKRLITRNALNYGLFDSLA